MRATEFFRVKALGVFIMLLGTLQVATGVLLLLKLATPDLVERALPEHISNLFLTHKIRPWSDIFEPIILFLVGVGIFKLNELARKLFIILAIWEILFHVFYIASDLINPNLSAISKVSLFIIPPLMNSYYIIGLIYLTRAKVKRHFMKEKGPVSNIGSCD